MIGQTLAHYRITAKIGAGGMGEVYRAKDTRLGRDVAIKVLSAELAQDPERLARFEREARLLAVLNHSNIAHVYGFESATLDDGTEAHFLAMEMVEGEDLAERLKRGPIPVDEALAIAEQIAEGLEEAHEHGIVHRDLKPANAKVTTEGKVKVLDFGLAKVTESRGGVPIDSEAETEMLTREGVVMGTVPYMSPEQVSGRTVDHRTDIFSFGVILYEMASGRRPFDGGSAVELGSAILRDTPPPLTSLRPGLPEGLIRVVNRCLEKDPAARFASMQEVHGALSALAAGGSDRRTISGYRPGLRSRALPVAGVAILLGVAAYWVARSGTMIPGWRAQEAPIEPQIRSIAVLPLDNYSGDPTQDYFAEGMTDELTADLARISRIRVISRGSAMQFKGDDRPSTPEIAKILDVDAIVEGSVLRAGDTVRINAQLIDARADRHLWARSFERSSQDVLTLQGELASAIAREINVELTPAEQTQLGSATSVDPEAYDAYLKGRYFFNRPSDENLKKAIARFQDAIALNPDFVPALSGLSDAYLWAGYNEGIITASEARPKAKAAAEKAIRLDDNSAEAHTSLAVFKLFYEFDWEGCEVEFRRAFELNPNYAYAHDQFALGLAFQGRFDESIAESRRAAELDPLNPQIPIDAIFALAWQDEYQAAKDQVKRAADLDPTFFFPPFAYGWIDIQAGMVEDAIPHLQQAKTMGAPAFVSAWLSYAYGASGNRASAQAELEELKNTSLNGVITPFDNALVALGMGDHARAVSLLEQAYALDSQWLGWLKNDRIFDPLRTDPRFAALLKKLGFED